MIYLASALIFTTSAIALYALILSKRNIIMMMFLIPSLLISSTYAGYSIYALQGTPISASFPTDENVELVWVEAAKPWIRLLLRLDNEEEAVYYKIPHTENNVNQIKEAVKKAKEKGESTGIEGTFKKTTGGDELGGEYTFIRSYGTAGPPKGPTDEEKLELEYNSQGVDQAIINSHDRQGQGDE